MSKWRYGKQIVTCSAFLLMHGSAAWANDIQLARNDLINAPIEILLKMEVESASKFKQTINEAPSAVSVITSTEIKTFGWRTLAEILNSLPGTHLSNDRMYSYMGARGFVRSGDNNPRFLLMIDGYRTNDPIYDQGMLGQEFLLDVDLIDRVEYVPGPGSAIYGSNAFFGVINVITKKGRDINGIQASAEGGNLGVHKERVTLGGKSENGVEWLLSATKFNREGKDLTYPQYPGQVARGLDYERVENVFGKLAAGPFSLAFGHAKRTKGLPTGVYETSIEDPGSKAVDASSYIDVGYQKYVNTNTEVTANINYSRYQYQGDFAFGDDNPSHDRHTAQWWSGGVKVVSTAFARHKLVTGVEIQNNHSIRMRSFNENPYVEAQNIHQRNYKVGLYVQDEWALRQDLLLSMGMRYDYNTAITDRNNVNPRLGLIYKLTPATTAKLLFGRAYRAPNAFELYYNDQGLAMPTQKAPTSLRPEHIQSNELVLEHQWAGNNRLRLSAYRNRVRDMIALKTDTTDNLLVFDNIDSATAYGMEAEWQQVWNNGTRLRTSASWQRATDDSTGAVLANAPKFLGKLNLSAPFYHDIWRAGLEVQYVSPRDTLQSTKVGGYTLTNLTLISDRLYKGVELSASVYNLFNHRYEVPVGPEFVQDAIQQDGRTFRVKLTYSF